MRLYCVATFYMRSVHAGIQSLHAVHEMYEKYLNQCAGVAPSDQLLKLRAWAGNHKTTIVLKGGEPADLHALYYDVIVDAANELELPHARFLEPSLNNSFTSFAIVLPEDYYNPMFVPSTSYEDMNMNDPMNRIRYAIGRMPLAL